jgi:hypothetical protein
MLRVLWNAAGSAGCCGFCGFCGFCEFCEFCGFCGFCGFCEFCGFCGFYRFCEILIVCERSLGTGFQLPSQDAIYNQDEEKRKKSGSHLALFGFAHGPQGCEGKRQGKRKEARPRA